MGHLDDGSDRADEDFDMYELDDADLAKVRGGTTIVVGTIDSLGG